MNKYVKSFLHRGLIFGGFGPIVVGIVYAILQGTTSDFSLSGSQVMVAVLSSYALAFIQAGTSVFNQIEHWPLAKSLLCHFAALYAAYLGCYLINAWIPFSLPIVLIFSGAFLVGYLVILGIVYLVIKSTEKKMNGKIAKK